MPTKCSGADRGHASVGALTFRSRRLPSLMDCLFWLCYTASLTTGWGKEAMDAVFQRSIAPGCAATLAVDDMRFSCPRCGGLVDVAYAWDQLPLPNSLRFFEKKWADRSNPLSFSGVW